MEGPERSRAMTQRRQGPRVRPGRKMAWEGTPQRRAAADDERALDRPALHPRRSGGIGASIPHPAYKKTVIAAPMRSDDQTWMALSRSGRAGAAQPCIRLSVAPLPLLRSGTCRASPAA